MRNSLYEFRNIFARYFVRFAVMKNCYAIFQILRNFAKAKFLVFLLSRSAPSQKWAGAESNRRPPRCKRGIIYGAVALKSDGKTQGVFPRMLGKP